MPTDKIFLSTEVLAVRKRSSTAGFGRFTAPVLYDAPAAKARKIEAPNTISTEDLCGIIGTTAVKETLTKHFYQLQAFQHETYNASLEIHSATSKLRNEPNSKQRIPHWKELANCQQKTFDMSTKLHDLLMEIDKKFVSVKEKETSAILAADRLALEDEKKIEPGLYVPWRQVMRERANTLQKIANWHHDNLFGDNSDSDDGATVCLHRLKMLHENRHDILKQLKTDFANVLNISSAMPHSPSNMPSRHVLKKAGWIENEIKIKELKVRTRGLQTELKTNASAEDFFTKSILNMHQFIVEPMSVCDNY